MLTPEVIERHHMELERHCQRLLGSSADAEDALQDALLRAWRARRNVNSGCPRAWLYRIATNSCHDLRARRQVTVPLEEGALTGPSAETVVLAQETVELALLTAIQQLPPRQHASFVLRDVLRHSAAESAVALSTSVAACNSALQRARDGLRDQLPPDRLEWTCAPASASQRVTLDRYLEAVRA